MPPRVLILYNMPVLPVSHPDAASEYEIITTAESVERNLQQAGMCTTRLGVADPRTLLNQVWADPPDVIFNLFEGLAERGHTEVTVAGLLEWLEIPFTGSPSQTLAMARDKYRTKHLLQGAGLPTPGFLVVEHLPCPECHLDWPVIVKPALQDASVGIEQGSVVTSQEQLQRRVAYVLQRYGPPVLVERFIHGREFHVSLIDTLNPQTGARTLLMLPLAEIVFLEEDPSYWPIYSYDAKWRPETREYEATPLQSPVMLEVEQMQRLSRLGRQAYHLLGCRDYARIDVRLDAAGQFHILEVNPNPFLNSIAMVNGLAAIGRTHAEFVVGLVRLALARGEANRTGGATLLRA